MVGIYAVDKRAIFFRLDFNKLDINMLVVPKDCFKHNAKFSQSVNELPSRSSNGCTK